MQTNPPFLHLNPLFRNPGSAPAMYIPVLQVKKEKVPANRAKLVCAGLVERWHYKHQQTKIQEIR